MFFADLNYSNGEEINFIRLPVSNQRQVKATFVYLATLYKHKEESFFREEEDVLVSKNKFVPMEEIQTQLLFEEIQAQKPFPKDMPKEDVMLVVDLKKILDIMFRLKWDVVTRLYSTKETLRYFLEAPHYEAFKTEIRALTPEEFGEWVMSDIFKFINNKQ